MNSNWSSWLFGLRCELSGLRDFFVFSYLVFHDVNMFEKSQVIV